MRYTTECPNCEEKIDISEFHESLRNSALDEGDSSEGEENLICEHCNSEIRLEGSCWVDVFVEVESPILISVGDFSNLSDGEHEINGKVVSIESGEVLERYALPDENQFSLFEEETK